MNIPRVLAGLAGVAAGVAVGAILLMLNAPAPPGHLATPSSALESDPNVSALSIPDFQLTNQDGEAVDAGILDGRLTIVDFIFTNCPFICPPMTQNMAHAQDQLEGAGVRFLSFSVDPAHDTPEVLRRHALAHGADLATWTFLTGDQAVTNSILRDGLMLAELRDNVSTPIALPGGETMANITHPGHFILIGPDRRVITMLSGTDRMQVEILIARARDAALELRTN